MSQSIATLGIKVSTDGAREAARDLEHVSDASAKAERQVKALPASLDKATMSAKQLQAATRGLPAQFTDIATSLASGQRPLQVLMQQGGQIKDMFGGIGAATRAMGSYLAAFVTPVNLAAAAVVGLGFAWYKASTQFREMENALTMSGASAELTAGKIELMTGSIAGAIGTVGAAREAFMRVVEGGKITGEAMEQVARAAVAMEVATGRSADETVKAFEKIAGDPVKGLIELNEKYNFLTVEVYEHIKALQEQGREEEALSAAMQIASGELTNRANEVAANADFMSRKWQEVKRNASEAWAEMARAINLQFETDEKQRAYLERAQSISRIKGLARYIELNPNLSKPELEHHWRQMAAENAKLARLGPLTAPAGTGAGDDQRKLLSATIDWDREHDKYLTRAEQRQKEITRTRQMGIAAGKSEAQIAEQIARIEERYKEKPAAKGRKPSHRGQLQAIEATSRLEIQAIKDATRAELEAIERKDTALERAFKKGVVDSRQYYDTLIKNQEEYGTAQARGIENEIEALKKKSATGVADINNQRKIAELEAALVRAREQNANKINEIVEQRDEMLRREREAIDSYRASVEGNVKAIRDEFSARVAGIQMGRAEFEQRSALAGITAKQVEEQRRLDALLSKGEARGGISRATYDEMTRANIAAAKAARDAWLSGTAEVQAAQSDWRNGARAAMQDYVTQARDVAGQTKDAFGRAFQGIEDAIVDFTMTGKANFDDLVKSILADFIRMETRILLSKAFDYFKNLGNGGGAAGKQGWGNTGASWIQTVMSIWSGKETGGPVEANKIYRVNERGPELLNLRGKQFLMMGQQSGSITPNHKIQAASGEQSFTQVNNFHYSAPYDARTAQQSAARIEFETRRASRRNG